MKIIDSHLHVGNNTRFNISFPEIEKRMELFNVKYGIVSSISSIEYFGNGEYTLLKDGQFSINKKLFSEIEDKDNFKMEFWIRPYFEPLKNEVCDFILKNRKKIIALKIHPFCSNMPITDKKMAEYLDFANSVGLPVAVHTAKGYDCEFNLLYKVAKKYKNVNFIGVHCDLETDHTEAVNFMSECGNLYGDTSWMIFGQFEKLYKIAGEKMLFGSDIAINKDVGYEYYKHYFEKMDKYADIFNKNIEKAFKTMWN